MAKESNPLVRRYSKRLHGAKSERRVAKKLGAKPTPASGSLPGAKGDAILPSLLIESKATVKKAIKLKRAWLDKITQEALDKNRAPAITLSFVVGSGESKAADWIVLPIWYAKRLNIFK